jgi:predicted nucleotidyltransferase
MPTALELGKDGWNTFVGNKRSYPQLSDPQIIERDELLNLVNQAANMLKQKYNPRKIILFGSLAHKAWFNESSDVDLAVEGLSSDNYWQAWRDVEDIITDRMIDFVDISDIAEPIKDIIESEGIEL